MCTSYISALYLHNMNFQGKIYVVGNHSMGAELDRFGLKHTGIGVSMMQYDGLGITLVFSLLGVDIDKGIF